MTMGIVILLFAWVLAFSMTGLGTVLTLRHFKKSPPYLDAPFNLYPVSILKPLKGIDEGIEENLETFFHLNYPEYELIFSVAESADPAYSVITKLMTRYPHIPSRLIVGQIEAGPNPKVNNLIQSYEQAKHDLLIISDSNVRVERSYLKRLVAHLDPSVGLVTAVVAGQNQKGVGGFLEATYLNTFYARWMLLAAQFGRPCVVGKSMLFRRSTAERFGGIRVLARYLAEDFMAGEAMLRLGLRVVIMSDPVSQFIGRHSFSAFWSRHIRWGRIRKNQALFAFLIEPLFGAIISGILGALAFKGWMRISPSTFLSLHLSVWAFCDFLLMKRLEPKLNFYLPLAWFYRELLALPLWLHIALGNTVKWRGKRFTIRSGGLLEIS